MESVKFEDLRDDFDHLWNALVLLTVDDKARLKILNSEHFAWGERGDQDSKKFTQRLFLAYSTLNIRNQKCNPLHFIVADKVDKHSISTELVTYLNQFGISVSEDSYKRMVQDVANKSMSDGRKKGPIPGAVRIATVDNIDKSNSFEAVKTDDVPRSFHGTSVVYNQPMPSFVRKSEQLSMVPDSSSDPVGEKNTCNLAADSILELVPVPSCNSLADQVEKEKCPKPRTMSEAGESRKII